MKRVIEKLKDNQGIGNLITVIYIMPILLFLAFFNVPILQYHVKHDKLLTVANIALKETEAVGYMSESIKTNTINRLSQLNMNPVTINGVLYPDFNGSSDTKKFRDSADPSVSFVMKYPAPRLDSFIGLIGGRRETNTGYYKFEKYGRSEAYE